jgi:cysteinyl-tRNA synthetase
MVEQIILTNTLSGKREPFKPGHDNSVSMYVCGITPYDYAHIGHGRCYVTFDLLYRILRFVGYNVTYCRNFTDIDDKLLERARKKYGNEARYKEVADFYITAYEKNMEQLACLPPTYEPRVTDHIEPIIKFVQELIDTGHAYVADGDVYFSIKTFPAYGKLSKRDITEMIAGARVSINEKKRDPLDFALWKGEPAGTFWLSPWGYGRPGWHIECSALAKLYLGDQLDIHGGGMDLIFPHHENEIAQSESLTHLPMARFWVHNAFVRVNREKMSKSLGNFVTLNDLFERYEPMVIRYLFLQHQYRNPLDFSFDELASVRKSYQRLIKLFEREGLLDLTNIPFGELSPLTQRAITLLSDDLNTPGMLGVIFEHYREISESRELALELKAVLVHIAGLALEPLPEKAVEITPEIEALLKQREEARARRDWATADFLRDRLRDLGVEVQDKKAQAP